MTYRLPSPGFYRSLPVARRRPWTERCDAWFDGHPLIRDLVTCCVIAPFMFVVVAYLAALLMGMVSK